MQNDIDNILNEIASKDSQVLCREVLSIGDTMDVLRSKWTVEILTAILCGSTRFKDILTAVHGLRLCGSRKARYWYSEPPFAGVWKTTARVVSPTRTRWKS